MLQPCGLLAAFMIFMVRVLAADGDGAERSSKWRPNSKRYVLDRISIYIIPIYLQYIYPNILQCTRIPIYQNIYCRCFRNALWSLYSTPSAFVNAKWLQSHRWTERPGSLSSPPSTCENEIMMEAAEIDVLKAFLHPEVVMFEFGSGVAFLPSHLKRSPWKKAPMIEASRARCGILGGDVQHPTPKLVVSNRQL